MTPKVVLYYYRGNEAEYKILRSLNSAQEFLLEKNRWPILIDLSFKPMIAVKACAALRNCPAIPFVSQSLTLAISSEDLSFVEDRFIEIESTKAFPLLSLMGQPILARQEVLPLKLSGKSETIKPEKTYNVDEKLKTPLSQFIFSVRLSNVFGRENILTIGDTLKYSEADILRFRNCGRNSLNELKLFLKTQGYSLKGSAARPNIGEASNSSRLIEKLKTPLNQFVFSVRLTNILDNENILTIEDILKYSEADILRLPNCGRNSLYELKLFLQFQGYSLKGSKARSHITEPLNSNGAILPGNVSLNEGNLQDKGTGFLNRPLTEYNFSQKTLNDLHALNILEVGDFHNHTQDFILKLAHNSLDVRCISTIYSQLRKQKDMGLTIQSSVTENSEKASSSQQYVTQPDQKKDSVDALDDETVLKLLNEINEPETATELLAQNAISSNFNGEDSSVGEFTEGGGPTRQTVGESQAKNIIEISPTNIFENFLSALEKIDERHATILKKRIGLGESRKTLEQLSTTFGVTRQRVQQLEKKAITAINHPQRGWNPDNVWGLSLKNILDTPYYPITPQKLVVLDERFDFQEFGEEALYHLIKNLLSNNVEFHSIFYNGNTYYAQENQDTFNATLEGIKSILPSLEGQAMTSVETAVKGIIPKKLSVFMTLLLSDALEHSLIEEIGEVTILKSYAMRMTAKTVARRLLEDVKEPITNETARKIISQNYPDVEFRSVMNAVANLSDVFPMAHGVWGTIKMLGFTDNEMVQLKTLFSDFLTQLNKDQFHSNELHTFLATHNVYFNVKLDSYKISALLQHFKIGHYLGRNMFSKAEGDANRILLKDIVINYLTDEQKPVKKNMIIEAVNNIRSFDGDLNLGQMPEIVNLGKGYYALTHWTVEVTDDGCFYQTQEGNQKLFMEFSSQRSDLRKQWADEEISNLIDLHKQGLSGGDIAQQMGLTRYAVYSGLKEYVHGDITRTPELDLFVPSRTSSGKVAKLNWTASRTELLKKMSEDGVSASEIARRLGGGATRNSVLGKLHRLKLDELDSGQAALKIGSNGMDDWSKSEIRQLTTLVELGYEIEVLSKILKKPQDVIENKIQEIAL